MELHVKLFYLLIIYPLASDLTIGNLCFHNNKKENRRKDLNMCVLGLKIVLNKTSFSRRALVSCQYIAIMMAFWHICCFYCYSFFFPSSSDFFFEHKTRPFWLGLLCWNIITERLTIYCAIYSSSLITTVFLLH